MDLQLNELVKVDLVDGRVGTVASSVNTVALVVLDSVGKFAEAFPTGKAFPNYREFATAVNSGNYDTGDDPEQVSEDDRGKWLGDAENVLDAVSIFFMQDRTPANITILPVTAADYKSIEKAVMDAADAGVDFYHVAIIASGDFADLVTKESIVDLNNKMASVAFKMIHIGADKTEKEFEDLHKSLASVSGLKRVALYNAHKDGDETNGAKNNFWLGLISGRCGSDPARGTWAHKTVNGAESSDSIALAKAKEMAFVNIYKKVAGENRSFMGWTVAGGFIDDTVKQDWIKFNIEIEVYNALRLSNSGFGIEFNDSGIAQVQAIVGNVLSTASDSDHRYIADDFTVDGPLFKDLTAQDKKDRNISGINASCSLLGAVHTVLDIVVNFT